MAAKQPLRPLALAVLGLLDERPMHPYEMFQLLLARKEDRLMRIRAGSLYHAVGRLEEAKLILAHGVDRDGNRPERTTYELTELGSQHLRDRLREMLAIPAEEYPAFLLAMAEAHVLPLEEVIDLLTTRRQALLPYLERLDAEDIDALARGVPQQYKLDVQYAQAVRRAELKWLDDLITTLCAGQMPWGTDTTHPHPSEI